MNTSPNLPKEQKPQSSTADMSKHNFVRNEYRTDYSQLNNQQYSIYCTQCGYVSFDTHSDYDNDKRQANLPAQCPPSTSTPQSNKEQV